MLLTQFADKLRSIAAKRCTAEAMDEGAPRLRCPGCSVRWNAEDRAIQSLLAKRAKAGSLDRMALSPLCLPHLRLILARSSDQELSRYLLERGADFLERTAEDMQRFAIRHEALKRGLTSTEERTSYIQALQMLVGHRNVNAVFTLRDIL